MNKFFIYFIGFLFLFLYFSGFFVDSRISSFLVAMICCVFFGAGAFKYFKQGL